MRLPESVRKVVSVLENAGFEAYAVGGYVRDRLYNEINGGVSFREVGDFDFATSALPHEIHKALSEYGYRLVDTGIKHGTVTVVLPDNKLEITTFRIDGKYSDNRRPDFVRFSKSLREDLSRRDFTVNAMAFSEKTGLIDFFGGQEDLKNKVLKCVGKPAERFSEDALRIMRALRFMSEHGFSCESETKKALFSEKNLLEKISPERIQSEICRIIQGKYVEYVLFEYKDIIAVVIPELKPCFEFSQINKHHVYDVYTHTIKALSASKNNKAVRLAILLHDVGKPSAFSVKNGVGHFYGHAKISAEIGEKVLSRLKFDNETKNRTIFLIKFHDCKIGIKKNEIKQMLRRFGKEAFFQLLDVHRADDSAKADFVKERIKIYENAEKIAREIIDSKECYSLGHLNINGHDLIEKGYKGKAVGEVLEKLLTAVINEKVKNEKANLLDFLDKI